VDLQIAKEMSNNRILYSLLVIGIVVSLKSDKRSGRFEWFASSKNAGIIGREKAEIMPDILITGSVTAAETARSPACSG
jgi:hypothetical protein